MSRSFVIKELEVSLKIEKSSNIKKLHNFIFENYVDRKKRQRIQEFTGFPFKTETDEYEEKIRHVTVNFLVNDLTTICNVPCIDNACSLEVLTAKITCNPYDLSILKLNIVHEDNGNSDNVTEINVESVSSGKFL